MSALILAISLIAMEMEVWPLAPGLLGGGMFVLLFVLAAANDVLLLLHRISGLR